MTKSDDTQPAPDRGDRTEHSIEVSQSAAEADEAALTWTQDDTDDNNAPYSRRSPARQRLKEATGLTLLSIMLLGGIAVTFVNATNHPPRQPAPSPVKGPIDGIYRVDRYRGEGTTSTPDGNISGVAPKHSSIETEWWAFQSVCQPSSCVAVGARLDNTTNTQTAARLAPDLADTKKKLSLRLISGKWMTDPPDRGRQDCAAGLPGHEMWRFTVELTQLADGTLRGREYDSIESNECGRAGTVATTPITATRTGDLPAGVSLLTTK